MEGKRHESAVERLLRELGDAASKMSSICAREQLEQFAPFWASVARVASTLAEEPTREYVQRLVRDVFSLYRYHPDSFMDMYVARADPDEQLRESEAFDALRDKIRRLAAEVDDAATGLPP